MVHAGTQECSFDAQEHSSYYEHHVEGEQDAKRHTCDQFLQFCLYDMTWKEA